MNGCSNFQARFSEYLDGCLTGLEMQSVAAHIDSCRGCASEWASLRQTQAALAFLGPVPEPRDLPLRIRVAVSHARARRARNPFQQWNLAWRNTVGPFLLQAAAGFASAVLLLGTVGVLVSIVAKPEAAQAGDEPLGTATAPRLIYSISGTGDNDMAALPAPVVVEAYVNDSGQVYDFDIVSGPDDASTRAEVENMLLSDRFEPARFWGQPVRGVAVLNFAGVSVRG
ncbi:MAG TPA: anti-sigma factor [Terracidiphilus sp.]|jgi:anti-sigma factor RsiW|nr:anti-sigma factor [Terracidiphilus sp.]